MSEEVFYGAEVGGEISAAESDCRPHGFDAVACDAVEPGVLNFGEEAVSAKLGDETGDPLGSALGLGGALRRSWVELGLEVAVAEAVYHEGAAEHGGENRDGLPLGWVEACDAAPAQTA